MNELQMLRAALAEPDASREAVERSRDRLRGAMCGPTRSWRIGWRVAALSLTTATAAAAVMIVAALAAPRETPNSPRAPDRLSARQVLLAAASTAESRPATSGTYWHVTTVFVSPDGRFRQTSGTWTRHDGQAWISLEPGKISKLSKRQSLRLSGTDLDFEQIQRLPTDPDRLLATLRGHVSGPKGSAEIVTHYALSELLDRAPAPPKVRAAAFRALASLPHIKNLGKVKGGGYALEFKIKDAGTRLIVDPKTTTATAEGFTSFGGGRQSMGPITATGEWTNQLPPYQVVPLARQKKAPDIQCHDEGDTPVCTQVGG